MIPFNRADVSGQEERYLTEALHSGHLSGNGPFSKLCCHYFEQRLGIPKALLTSSCTDALEMCALLLELRPGDEVILPSFTFVSTANAFLLRGAELKFADSSPSHPNLDLDHVQELLSPRTRAIVVVHYGGVACDMDRLNQLAGSVGALIIEDAAHAIDAYYKGQPLGTLGALGAFSFHETKNVTAGEGGLLVVNDPALAGRAEILWEKGTNRSQFFRGEVDKYGWMDLGSSFLASELAAAVLWGQLQRLDEIQKARLAVWHRYHELILPFASEGIIELPAIPEYATNNAHLFAIICRDLDQRTQILSRLHRQGVYATFHYQPLHCSPFFASRYQGKDLIHAKRYGDCLLRLPIFSGMTEQELCTISAAVDSSLRCQ